MDRYHVFMLIRIMATVYIVTNTLVTLIGGKLGRIFLIIRQQIGLQAVMQDGMSKKREYYEMVCWRKRTARGCA